MNDLPRVLVVYLTAANREEADRIAGILVQEQAAACVNILGPIDSVYRWQGKVERAGEIAMLAKTTDQAFPRLEKLVRENHSYECPCVVAMPVDAGHLPFLDWVRGSVS